MRGLGPACKNVKKGLLPEFRSYCLHLTLNLEKKVFEEVFQLILRNPPEQHF